MACKVAFDYHHVCVGVYGDIVSSVFDFIGVDGAVYGFGGTVYAFCDVDSLFIVVVLKVTLNVLIFVF